MLALPFVPELPLQTERLTLRRFGPADFEPLLAFHSMPAVVRYVPYEPRNRDTMATALAHRMAGTALRAEGDHLDLAVVLADGTLVGDVVLILSSIEHQTAEVGYLFHPAYGGRGYATESVRALLDLAFTGLHARRVVARIDARNRPSRALCDRLGLRLEAHLIDNEWFKGEWTSETDYAVLAREWPTVLPAPLR